MSDIRGFGDIQIIVADKGFVFLGYVLDNDDGSVIISCAQNLRRWGTTKGLGELCTGPTDKTVYDYWGLVHTKPIIRLNVESGWDDILKASAK
jgi:hypothetical protein